MQLADHPKRRRYRIAGDPDTRCFKPSMRLQRSRIWARYANVHHARDPSPAQHSSRRESLGQAASINWKMCGSLGNGPPYGAGLLLLLFRGQPNLVE